MNTLNVVLIKIDHQRPSSMVISNQLNVDALQSVDHTILSGKIVQYNILVVIIVKNETL